jgi:hypothetical protein
LTLIHSENLTDRELPSSDQFDHMIVSVPGPDGGDQGRIFLDCTAKYRHPGQAICSASPSEVNEAFLLDPLGSRLVAIPCRQADWAEIRCRREVSIAWDDPLSQTADALVREQVSYNPSSAWGLRAALSAMEPREHKSTLAGMLSVVERIDISALSIENLEEPWLPLVLNLEYRVENAFHKIDGEGEKFVGRLPVMWESCAAGDINATERLTPFRRQGAALHSVSRITLPPGYVAGRAFEPARSPEQSRFVAWAVDADPATQTRTFTFHSLPGIFPASDYAMACGEAKQLADYLQRPITIERAAP